MNKKIYKTVSEKKYYNWKCDPLLAGIKIYT